MKNKVKERTIFGAIAKGKGKLDEHKAILIKTMIFNLEKID